MALGIIITTKGGVPILIKEISPIFKLGKTGKEALISSIISAMVDFASEALKTDINKIALGSYHLYVVKNDEYMVCVIDDMEDEYNYEIAKKILEFITERKIGDTPIITEEDEQKLWREILDIIGAYPRSIKVLEEAHTLITGFIDEKLCPSLNNIMFKRRDITKEVPIEKIFTVEGKKKSEKEFMDLLEDMLNLRVPDNLVDKPWVFDNINEDFTRALYINYNLMLRTIEEPKPSAEFDILFKIANGIKDEVLKDILVRKIILYMVPNGYKDFFDALIKYKREVQEEIKNGGVRGKILLLSVTTMNHFIYNILGDISKEVKEISKPIYYVLKYFEYIIKGVEDFEEFLVELSELRKELKTANGMLEKILISKAMLSLSRNLLRSFPVEYDDFKKILKENISNALDLLEDAEKHRLSLEIKNSFITSLTDWLPFIIFCKHINLREKVDLKELEELALTYLKKTFEFYHMKRINLFSFISYTIKYLLMLSYIMQVKKKCYIDPLKIIGEFFMKEYEDAIIFAKNLYWYYFQRALYILLFYANYIEIKAVKRTLLEKLSYNIDAILGMQKPDSPDTLFALVNQTIGLYLSGDPALQVIVEHRLRAIEPTIQDHIKQFLDDLRSCVINEVK